MINTNTKNLRIIFGMKLKSFRKKAGLSLKQLASRSGLSVSYLSEIEQGKKYPKPDKMLLLADSLDVPFDTLVSLKVDEELNPITALMHSSLLKEFPFEFFGISSHDFLNLFRQAPKRAQSFLQTFVEIGQKYDMGVDSFLYAALRTYQKLHHNHFPELEKEAKAFLQEYSLNDQPGYEQLRRILEQDHGYRVKETSLSRFSGLKGLRSIWHKGPPARLFVNRRLLEGQKAFIAARELGHRRLGHKERSVTSSWLKVTSFDQLLNHFQASYFAGAALLSAKSMKRDIKKWFAQKSWQPSYLLNMMRRYQATPEMFLYRLSQLLPGVFQLNRIFYFRFNGRGNQQRFLITKELNMTGRLVPYGTGTNEHYCRRWLPLKLLMEEPGHEDYRIGIQRVRFVDSRSELLMIGLSRPLVLSEGKNAAMTLGIVLDDNARNMIRFVEDPDIPFNVVNETCERCPLTDAECSERAAPASHYAHARQLAVQTDELSRFLDGIS